MQLLQERRDLRSELESFGATVDLSSVEKAFLKAAKPYSENKGISYATWREAGVPAIRLAFHSPNRSFGT